MTTTEAQQFFVAAMAPEHRACLLYTSDAADE